MRQPGHRGATDVYLSRGQSPPMGEEELKLLITVVVGAQDDGHARGACQDLLRLIGGTVVESRDCSDEEPGCWSVTISRGSGVSAVPDDPAGLARAVRVFVRTL